MLVNTSVISSCSLGSFCLFEVMNVSSTFKKSAEKRVKVHSCLGRVGERHPLILILAINFHGLEAG
jgi:hypothetical protein